MSHPKNDLPADPTPANTPTTPDADVTALRQQLEAREQSLVARTHTLNEREAEVEAAQAKAQRDLADLARRLKQVADSEGAVESRARDVAQRELEASAGFAARSRDALATLTQSHAQLRAEVERTQAALDTARLQGVETLERWLLDERNTRLAALDAELKADRVRHQTRLAAEGKAHEEDMARHRAQFDAERRTMLDELARQRAELQAEERTCRQKRKELDWREADLEGEKAGIERTIEEQTRDQVAFLQRQLGALREDCSRRADTIAMLESRLSESEALLTRFGHHPAEIEKRLQEQAHKVRTLETELLSRPSASDKERLIALQQLEQTWTSERDRLVQEVGKLRADQFRWLTGVADLEQQRDENERLTRQHDNLLKVFKTQEDSQQAALDKLKVDVDRMRTLYERPEERAARVESIEQPLEELIGREQLGNDEFAHSELGWLGWINEACNESGMKFPPRLLHAFHTSLKAAELSPLAVLAGVSGTGKSELPRLYARFGGINFLSLAVQPNWDSPQSLFGFFNSVDNRFNATPVLRAMVQAQHAPDHETYRHGLSDRMLLILLDEMNLAHVEQYFSDLLSKLEKRRGEDRDVTLDIDLGAGVPPYSLRLGRNVLWVGTMNEDETTKSLSDKVIDRSNLLYFPRPKTLHSRANVSLHEESPLITAATWLGWRQCSSPFTDHDIGHFRSMLEEINQRLEHVGRALGHRVWQSVEYYMANHPEVIAARAGNDQDDIGQAMRRAYEDQVVLKVMPKLRGIETSGDAKRNGLDPIRKLLENNGLGLSEDFDIACRVGHGAFVWNSARYLENVR